MSRIYLLIAILHFWQVVSGQHWFEGSPTWSYRWNDWGCIAGQTIGTVNWFYVRDTVIDDLSMALILQQRKFNSFGEVREDESLKVMFEEGANIYQYYPKDGSLNLVYSFELNQGDTIRVDSSFVQTYITRF